MQIVSAQLRVRPLHACYGCSGPCAPTGAALTLSIVKGALRRLTGQSAESYSACFQTTSALLSAEAMVPESST